MCPRKNSCGLPTTHCSSLRAQVPCTITDRKAPTVVVTICDCERSKMFDCPNILHVKSSTSHRMVLLISVQLCLDRFHQQKLSFFGMPASLKSSPVLLQCNGFLYIRTAICLMRHSSPVLQVTICFHILVRKYCFRHLLSMRSCPILTVPLMYLNCATVLSFIPKYPVKHLRQAYCNHWSSSLPVLLR